jgi:hypothetical protein
MFPRVTHPSATDILLCPFDLHVLSLPPAFALSQDQTLKLDLNFEPADHIVLTRSHHTWSIRPKPDQPAVRASQRKQRWCNLCIKTCTAEVFRPAPTLKHHLAANARKSRPARTPPSTFLFLHLNLSNNPMHKHRPPLREKIMGASVAEEPATSQDNESQPTPIGC